MAIGIAVAVVISSCLAYYLARFVRIWYFISQFKGPPAIPIFGNAFTIKGSRREYFQKCLDILNMYRGSTGGAMRFWIGPLPSLWIYSAKHSEVILSGSRHLRKNIAVSFLKPWLGEGLLLSYGQKWFHRRKLLTPTFHFSILRNFMDVFNEQSVILVQKLREFADKPDPVNIFECVTLCVLDVICDTAMGKHIHAQVGNASEYVHGVKRVSDLTLERWSKVWLWPDFVFFNSSAGREYLHYLPKLHDFTKKVIKERLREPPKQLESDSDGYVEDDGAVASKRKRVAFLDLLLKMHREDESFTLDDIREEVDTFMFEGFDTTAAGISWAVLLIGLYDDVQRKLHDELDLVFGDSDRTVTSDDLSRLSYLGCVIKETLRILPSVPGIIRQLDDDIMIDGKMVPKETIIIVSLYMLHRDPEVFPEPARFDPDRFLPENASKRHPYAYSPFSAGPRNCIGQRFATMEMKVVLASLLRRFRVRSAQTVEECKPTGRLIIRPDEDKILVHLSDRRK